MEHQLVTLLRITTPQLGNFVKDKLESNGIEVFFTNEGLEPGSKYNPNEVLLKIKAGQSELAVKTLLRVHKDYDLDRLDAESGWSAIRLNISYDYLISQAWLLHTGFSTQQTSNLLISGEQYGVGGVGSLRGFEERSVTGDSGYQLNIELWMPPWTEFGLRFSVFVDLANTEFNDGDSAGNEGVSFDLSSAGFGMHWAWKESLSVALNYGVISKGGGLDTNINQDGDDKLHMNLVYRF